MVKYGVEKEKRVKTFVEDWKKEKRKRENKTAEYKKDILVL